MEPIWAIIKGDSDVGDNVMLVNFRMVIDLRLVTESLCWNFFVMLSCHQHFIIIKISRNLNYQDSLPEASWGSMRKFRPTWNKFCLEPKILSKFSKFSNCKIALEANNWNGLTFNLTWLPSHVIYLTCSSIGCHAISCGFFPKFF